MTVVKEPNAKGKSKGNKLRTKPPSFTCPLPSSDVTEPRFPFLPASFPHNLFQCALCSSLYCKQTPALRLRLLMSTILMTCSSVLPSVNLWVPLPPSLRTSAPGSLSFSPAQLLGNLRVHVEDCSTPQWQVCLAPLLAFYVVPLWVFWCLFF